MGANLNMMRCILILFWRQYQFYDDEGQDPVKASYKQNYNRMVEFKRAYDLENLFRVHQNFKT